MLTSLWRNRTMMTRTFAYYSRKVSPAQRKAFFEVVKATQKVSPSLMPRMMFVHTGYLMDVLRAVHASAIAREQAALERAHPEVLQGLSQATLMSPAMREHMPAIARRAFGVVRPRVADREALFRLVLEAVADYHDRFGATLEAFDDVEADRVALACERVLAKAGQGTGAGAGKTDLPDAPPPGFAREMLDALDRAVNVAQGGWEDL